jgi:hypothetical protein
MPKLESATLQSPNSAPLGPGVLIANLAEFTPLGVASAIAGDTSFGYRLGAMTSAPSVSIARETIDLTENYVGINAMFKGATQIMRSDITLEVELAELTHRNLKLLHPGLSENDWLNSAVARLTRGAGNSQFNVVAVTAGANGNSITLALVAGTGNNVAVINAINNNAAASALIQAGLPITSDGSGVVTAAAAAPLASGTAGTKIGVRLKPTGFIPDTAYLRNIALVLEGKDSSVRQIWRVNNAIQTDDIDYEPDDEGNASSISATFTGHVGSSDRDPVTGIYLPPYEIYNLDVPVTL